MCIDKGTYIPLVLRVVLADEVEIDDDEPYGEPHLRSCQTNAFATVQGVVHILYQFFKFRIIWCDILGYLAEHRLAKSINRKNHLACSSMSMS